MSGSDSSPKSPVGASADAALWRRFAGALGDDVRATPVYRLKLGGVSPEKMAVALDRVIPPDPLRGEALVNNIWRIGNDRLTLEEGADPWSVAAPTRHYADRLHRFDWLIDLMEFNDQGRVRALQLVDRWIEEFGRFNGFAWRLGPTADRVWNWLLCGRTLFDETEAGAARIDNIARQIRHLKASLDASHDPGARWRGACIQLVDAIAFQDGKSLDAAIAHLETEYTAQILPDGGHVSRSPERLMRALSDVLVIARLFERTGRPTPVYLLRGIPIMGAMLAFFRAGDGALMPFHDGGEAWPEAVEAVLKALPSPPRRFSFAMKSGYQKLERGNLRLVLDSGPAPERAFAGLAHAGPLGFEFHDGAARIVTSCGFNREMNLDWQAAVRRTGAHSSLSLAGRDAAPFKTYEDTRLLTPIGPDGISAKRLEEADEIWLDAQHGGWKETFSLLHRRRLFMAADGSRLAGEDSLVRPISAGLDEDGEFVSFDIRFHLHPTVTSFTSGDAIRLTCDNGSVWRFKTTHPGATLEPSVYIARGRTEQTEQIVMSGKADPNGDGAAPPNCVRWAFLRDEAQ